MSVDAIVASLPALAFGAAAPLTRERFAEICGGAQSALYRSLPGEAWSDLETQLRNAVALARGGAKWAHPAEGCSLYWKNRVLACFQEKDVMKRDEALDRVRWEAAGELTPVASPLSRGALATYAVRLEIALRRARISRKDGNAAFDRLTAETKRD